MASDDKVNILLVDDQPAKLLSYETILAGLGEKLIKAASAKEALEHLLKHEIAVILVDVCMPELDGFQLAGMIREHPRFQRTAIIFISAIHLTDVDRLRAYEMGAVDYVPVPVIPEVLRSLALAAGQMGSGEGDRVKGRFVGEDGQYRFLGADPATFELSVDNVR